MIYRLVDADAARKAAEERADRLATELSRVSDQLKTEQQNYSNLQSSHKQLEVDIRDLSIRLEDAEFSKDGRKTLNQYKNRVRLILTSSKPLTMTFKLFKTCSSNGNSHNIFAKLHC